MAVSPGSAEAKNRIRRTSFFVVLALVTAVFFGLISNFLLACFWATVLAIIFRGTYDWFLKKMNGRENGAATSTVLFILIVVVLPIALVSMMVLNESRLVYEAIENGDLRPQQFLDAAQEKVPAIERAVARLGISEAELESRMRTFITNAVESAGSIALRYTQNAIGFLVQFTLMLYLLYFFIRDGDRIIGAIIDALPIGDEVERQLFERFTKVSRATLKGTVVVATLQGSIGGLLFWILGIPGAVLWGVVMIFLSLLPVGGSGIIWLPAAIILLIQGQISKGVIIIVVGALIIGLVDNLLRPRLVSRDTKMPDYLVLLSTLGGIAWFGISGFILGPVLAALFLTCWSITGQLFGENAEVE